MRHTLKAVFDYRSDARHAMDALLAAGYSRDDMALSRRPPMEQADKDHRTVSGEQVDSLGAAVKHTFTRLLGSLHHQNVVKYSTGIMRRGHVVTLNTESQPEATGAVGIIERFGPVGIEDRQDESDDAWVGTGIPGHEAATGEDGTQQPQAMSYRALAPGTFSTGSVIASRMSRAYPPGTAPGALQYRPPEHSHYFGTQNAYSPPTGNTFQETMGAVTQWNFDDGTEDASADLRSGSEGDDMAAYRYGNEMRTDDKYRNCSWDEAEPRLKEGWEALATKDSTWDGSRSAIRRGWNGTSPGIADDSYYRDHWNAIYSDSAGKPGYDDRTPAYLYGGEARRSGKYRSGEWRDVESELEADWKACHAGQLSSWEKFKDAVKHGWNRISLDMDGKDAARQSQHAGDGIGDDDLGAASRPGSDAGARIRRRP